MAFQPGNQESKKANHKRPKVFTQSLLAALKKTDSDNVEAIQRIADKLVLLAESGDIQAIKEVADRVEGKVPQGVVGDDEHDPIRLVQRIERVIVDASNPNGEGVPAASGAGEV